MTIDKIDDQKRQWLAFCFMFLLVKKTVTRWWGWQWWWPWQRRWSWRWWPSWWAQPCCIVPLPDDVKSFSTTLCFNQSRGQHHHFDHHHCWLIIIIVLIIIIIIITEIPPKSSSYRNSTPLLSNPDKKLKTGPTRSCLIQMFVPKKGSLYFHMDTAMQIPFRPDSQRLFCETIMQKTTCCLTTTT